MKVQDFDPRDYLRLNQFPHFLCPGCGHGIALGALVWAIHELELSLDKMAFVSGIGCSGRLTAYIDSNTFHVTHGRPIAFATGIALTRSDLKVVVITGDGDCLAIGGNHLIHACRRNLEMTCLMLNNEVYGMTGGQVSPPPRNCVLPRPLRKETSNRSSMPVNWPARLGQGWWGVKSPCRHRLSRT